MSEMVESLAAWFKMADMWLIAVWFLASLAFTLIVGALIVVNLPQNYFSSRFDGQLFSDSSPLLRLILIPLKNLVGLAMLILGIVLSLPGVPGQGLLTILLGLILLDIPGKRALEARIVGRPAILSVLNKLRARFGKPPLEVD
ncbi:MAG: hypothetical protein ACKN97_07040 [Acidobacteriota bacterium]